MSISSPIAWSMLIIGTILGIISSICYFIETRAKMYGRPSYTSHQMLIYPRISPVGPFLIFVTMLGKTPWNIHLIRTGIICLIIILFLFVLFTFLLRKGRKAVEAIPKGTRIRTDQDFVPYKYDLSEKTFRGTVTINGTKYKAYQTVEPPTKPIRINQNIIVESTDNYYLIVKPYNPCTE